MYLCICIFVFLYLYICVFVYDLDDHNNHRKGELVRGLCCVVVQRIAPYYVRRIVIANYFNQQKIPQTVHSQGLQSS